MQYLDNADEKREREMRDGIISCTTGQAEFFILSASEMRVERETLAFEKLSSFPPLFFSLVLPANVSDLLCLYAFGSSVSLCLARS